MKSLIILLFVTSCCALHAQVGIGTSNPNSKAILHLESTTSGFLPPRVLTSERIAINNNTIDASLKGLLLFDTDVNKLFIHTGDVWSEAAVVNEAPFRNQSDATAATNSSTNIYYNGGSLAVGSTTSNANAQLDVQSNSKGILIPRMTTADRTAISNPPESLLVFDTDQNLYYHYSTKNTAWLPINVGVVISIAATSYTLSVADNGKIVDFTASSAISVTVPASLPVGFQVSITQAGSGQITFSGSGAMTINNRWGLTKSSGQWAKVGLEVRANNSAVLSGDVQ